MSFYWKTESNATILFGVQFHHLKGGFMDINELLDEVKEKLGITSDYRLSKVLDISEQDLSKYRKGILMPDAYACFRFAEVLGKAPTVIIAQVQARKQRKESK